MAEPESRRVHSDLDASLLYAWGSSKHITGIQRRHVRHFRDAPGRVLDIGCGRGLMLELLKQAGVQAYGIDLSPEAVQLCNANGLEAVKADVLAHLRSLPERSLGGVFCSHVIEHLEPREALAVIAELGQVMKVGGKLVLITPDAADLRISERFWLDLTHTRPYPRKLLTLLLERAGFRIITTTHDREPTDGLLVAAAKIFLRLWFMGFMFRGDLVIVGERRASD